MLEVVINRPDWSRGVMGNQLLVSKKNAEEFKKEVQDGDLSPSRAPKHNKMCCLGSVCLALGVSLSEMRGRGAPGALINSHPHLRLPLLVNQNKDGSFDGHNEFASSAMIINDDDTITDTEREQKLQDLGRKHGVRFIFVGGENES